MTLSLHFIAVGKNYFEKIKENILGFQAQNPEAQITIWTTRASSAVYPDGIAVHYIDELIDTDTPADHLPENLFPIADYFRQHPEMARLASTLSAEETGNYGPLADMLTPIILYYYPGGFNLKLDCDIKGFKIPDDVPNQELVLVEEYIEKRDESGNPLEIQISQVAPSCIGSQQRNEAVKKGLEIFELMASHNIGEVLCSTSPIIRYKAAMEVTGAWACIFKDRAKHSELGELISANHNVSKDWCQGIRDIFLRWGRIINDQREIDYEEFFKDLKVIKNEHQPVPTDHDRGEFISFGLIKAYKAALIMELQGLNKTEGDPLQLEDIKGRQQLPNEMIDCIIGYEEVLLDAFQRQYGRNEDPHVELAGTSE